MSKTPAIPKEKIPITIGSKNLWKLSTLRALNKRLSQMKGSRTTKTSSTTWLSVRMFRRCTLLFQQPSHLTHKQSLRSRKLTSANTGSKCILLRQTCKSSKKSLAVEKISISRWKRCLRMPQVRSTLCVTLMTVNLWWELLVELRELKKRLLRMRCASTIYSGLMITPCQFKTSLILSLPHALSTITLFLSSCVTVQRWLITISSGISKSMP